MLNILEEEKCFNVLDFRVNKKEVRKAIKQLKNNKAVGLDLISNEMIYIHNTCYNFYL